MPSRWARPGLCLPHIMKALLVAQQISAQGTAGDLLLQAFQRGPMKWKWSDRWRAGAKRSGRRLHHRSEEIPDLTQDQIDEMKCHIQITARVLLIRHGENEFVQTGAPARAPAGHPPERTRPRTSGSCANSQKETWIGPSMSPARTRGRDRRTPG